MIQALRHLGSSTRRADRLGRGRRLRLARGPVVTALALVVLALVVLGGEVTPARADFSGPVDQWSSVVVTRLTLTDGRGTLTVQPRLRTEAFHGFEVDIPAGAGAWSGPDVVPVPELGVSCRRDTGPALAYRCGATRTGDPATVLPVGGFAFGIPVSYVGDATGLVGSTVLFTTGGSVGFEGLWAMDSDTFPVYGAGHVQSTAEGRVAHVDEEQDAAGAYRDVVAAAVTLTVVPGETVTALDLQLPTVPFTLRGTNAPTWGLQCYRRPAGPALPGPIQPGPTLHCKPATGRTAFPVGRSVLTLDLLGAVGEPFDGADRLGISLTANGGPAEPVDTMSWKWESYD